MRQNEGRKEDPKEARKEGGETRCPWCEKSDAYRRYHDEEWGAPIVDEQALYELFLLECFQAGLSWLTILDKRENFRSAFANFDRDAIKNFGESDVKRLMADPGIIRHEGKIRAAIENARRLDGVIDQYGGLVPYFWRQVGNKAVVGQWAGTSEIPVRSAQSDLLSKDLKKRGFAFVGSVTVHSLLQAAGLFDDHVAACFRKPPLAVLRKRMGIGEQSPA